MWKSITSKLICVAKNPSIRLAGSVKHIECLKSSVLLENNVSFGAVGLRPFSLSSLLSRNNEKRENAHIGKDDGTQGEIAISVDQMKTLDQVFPDENTPELLFDGIRFDDLPIVHIRVSKNNTKFHLTDAKGKSIVNHSCNMEGFKNARKKTTIAAQATGISMGMKMYGKGFRTVRARVAGLGPGRIAGVKGVTMAGVQVVAISDYTDVNYSGTPRAKKRRRI
uniref:30S ribosomal protein S11-like n=1 Tax=Hirondellea gigas TaxID=1518452 RepID=A0A6A7FSN6_9CRUS